MDTVSALVTLSWGILAMIGASMIFERRYWQWRQHRDRRGIRELLVAIAILIVALASFASMIVVAFGLGDVNIRRFFGAVAWGAFTALIALLVMWTPRTRSDH